MVKCNLLISKLFCIFVRCKMVRKMSRMAFIQLHMVISLNVLNFLLSEQFTNIRSIFHVSVFILALLAFPLVSCGFVSHSSSVCRRLVHSITLQLSLYRWLWIYAVVVASTPHLLHIFYQLKNVIYITWSAACSLSLALWIYGCVRICMKSRWKCTSSKCCCVESSLSCP